MGNSLQPIRPCYKCVLTVRTTKNDNFIPDISKVIPEVISNGESGTEIEMQSLLETSVPSGQNGSERQNGRERPSGRIQIDDRVQSRLTPDFDNRDIAGIRGVSDLRRRTTFVRNNEHHR